MSHCVSECPIKINRSENGEKISFFKFPKKRWLHTIRREALQSNQIQKDMLQTFQDIKELKRQLQHMQLQNDDPNDRLFTLENLKMKDSSATLYSGFPNWETFMVVYTYLDPGEKGENISYSHSTNLVL